MPVHDIIVVGASAGGVEALSYLVSKLPQNLNASLFIVLHVPSQGTSVLPKILSRAGVLPVSHAKDGEPIVKGHIYVAPPDYQLLVKPEYITLSRGPRENGHRPAIDPLFRTAALTYGAQVVGVLLTGALDDGTAGLKTVKIRHGRAVVQSPEDAMYPGMPLSAIENVDNIDYILPLSEIPNILINLASTFVEEKEQNPVTREIEIESDLAEANMSVLNEDDRAGQPSAFACPECGGTLWEIQEGNLLRFRCRIGHAYAVESLLAQQSDALENALWSALRALEEKSSLAHRMAKRMREREQNSSAEKFEIRAQQAEGSAALIRHVLLHNCEPSRPQLEENAAMENSPAD